MEFNGYIIIIQLYIKFIYVGKIKKWKCNIAIKVIKKSLYYDDTYTTIRIVCC